MAVPLVVSGVYIIPKHSMYAIYAYIGVVLGVNVGIYGIHGVSGISNIIQIFGCADRD